MNEQDYEARLHIKTIEVQHLYNAFSHYNRYEPTPYAALEELCAVYPFDPTDTVIDFGCGKGRLNFYLHDRFDCSVIGIEMNGQFYEDALANQIAYTKKMKKRRGSIRFEHTYAEAYSIPDDVTTCYFFNPFSIQIFMKVVDQILMSVERHPRAVDLILYYPADEYRYYLEHQTVFEQVEEVRLKELFEKNHDERFVIYRMDLSRKVAKRV
ncbi:SAM-dependent methyltransferase [Exiguobacterium sp. KRL4]|uniref:methyltransferase n=1 Tax=Exiguobacterium sp. KRL4 TaxID=1914536 RepID=UPI0008F84112|nr:methyltransferase [Exiguobacterium sp. KRL4]OIN67626.1 SAM-dependent methyltransferase [Exiguobacterium sp. KRL4]